jgi:hypothetical protein
VSQGFRKILIRGDTDFSQSERHDRWDADGTLFVFGFDAVAKLKGMAEDLSATAWQPLNRPPAYTVQTRLRRRSAKVKKQIVVEREFHNKRLSSEDFTEFAYQPTACSHAYRMVVVRKNISVCEEERAYSMTYVISSTSRTRCS